MTHRALIAIQSLFVFAALRFAAEPARPHVLDLPAPRTAQFIADCDGDIWLFDGNDSAYSAEAFQLNAAMSQASGALINLRALLSQISRRLPVPDIAAAATRFDHARDVLPAEHAFLFDEAPASVLYAARADAALHKFA
jgi:hypothetical protein